MLPPSRILRIFALVAVGSLTGSGCVQESATAPPPAVKHQGQTEEWFRTYLADQPAGSLRVVTRPLDNGGYRVGLLQELRLRRFESELNLRIETSIDEDARGHFTAFQLEQEMARNKIRSSGRVNAGKLTIREESPLRKAEEVHISVPPGAAGYRHAEEQLQAAVSDPAAPPETGARIHTVVFIPDLKQFGTETSTIGPVETVNVGAIARRLRRVTVTQEAVPGLVVTKWVDEAGRLEKFSMPILGVEIVYVRSTRDAVLGGEKLAAPEIFASSAIPVKRFVPRDPDRAVYRLRFRRTLDARVIEQLAAFRGQQILRREGEEADKSCTLQVERVPAPAPASLPVPAPAGAEGASYLRANTYIQSDDAAVSDATRTAIGAETDAWKAATKLQQWVHDNVKEKNLATAFASAREVLDVREGDCTEHGVLLAAMARAAGIPSRVVAGLVHSDGNFVGHMWTEVHIGGWIPLDSTRGTGRPVGSGHIALAASSLESRAVGTMFVGLVQVLGNLDIEVLEVMEANEPR